MELQVPAVPAPTSCQDVAVSDANRKLLKSWAADYPPWDPYEAPWPTQVRGRWFNHDIFHKMPFEETTEDLDLRNHHMMFWSSAAAPAHRLAKTSVGFVQSQQDELLVVSCCVYLGIGSWRLGVVCVFHVEYWHPPLRQE